MLKTWGDEMNRTIFNYLNALLLSLLLSNCASDSTIPVDSVLETNKFTSQSKIINSYLIGVDDTISVNVWRNPELSVVVPVRPDGKISMPLIGDVAAAGLTPESVASSIRNRLKNYVRDPNVTLMITDLQSHEYLTRVRITGAVNTPSSLNYRQGMTVLDAVLVAGGVNDFAAPNKTRLYRKIENKTYILNIFLGDILYQGELSTNVELRPGDIITVPERLF